MLREEADVYIVKAIAQNIYDYLECSTPKDKPSGWNAFSLQQVHQTVSSFKATFTNMVRKIIIASPAGGPNFFSAISKIHSTCAKSSFFLSSPVTAYLSGPINLFAFSYPYFVTVLPFLPISLRNAHKYGG